MNHKLFLSFALTAGLPIVASPSLNAQTPVSEPSTSEPSQIQPLDPQLSGPAQFSDAQSNTPQGYLDPNFTSHSSKPHPGQSGTAAAATPAPIQPSQTPLWYKNNPQAYDHGTSKPRHLHAPAKPLAVYDDSQPVAQPAPQQQIAQEEAPEQVEPRQQDPPAYDDRPTRQVQPLPRYYGQPDQQAYAPQPQQNYSQPQDYGDTQGYGDPQEEPQDDYGPAAGDAGQMAQQPLSAEQLEQLVAPVALYPDQLIAQILTASTYPAQITAADQWVRSMNGAAPEQIAQGASAQTAWDPSIKALTAFPQVLAMLDGNLQWTAALGNAYYNQPQDVLQTIQVLRQRAEQAGNLQSTPQAQVVQEPNYIQIQPANPQYVYLPSYNPWYAYGAPISPYPSFEFGNWGLYTGSGIEWGLGFAVGAFLRVPFGIAAWGCDWLGGAILFDHHGYWTHSHEMHDWGYAHGGRRWDGGYGRGGYGGRGYAHYGNYNHQPMNIHGGGPEARSGAHSFYGGRGQEQRYGGGGFSRPQAPGQRAFGGSQPFRPYGGQNFGGRPPATGAPQRFGGGSMPSVRPQPYGGRPPQVAQGPRPGNSFRGGYPRPGQGYMGRPAQITPYRSPQQTYSPRAFGGGSGGWGGGQAFSRAPQSGSHSFFGGGGHSAPSFGGGSHSFGGGGSHSIFGGGGHSFGGGSHSFSGGGGGHSFGGGGHSFGGGGGHSGGGHSSGGGGHRR
ncbi:MAG TPA: DUF3300 domain-containing protein [Terracidiphilus sp.]